MYAISKIFFVINYAIFVTLHDALMALRSKRATNQPSGKGKVCKYMQIFEKRMLWLSKNGCYTIRQLAVNGADLMQAGMPAGPAVGETLNTLLKEVMDGHLPNERDALLQVVRTHAGGTR